MTEPRKKGGFSERVEVLCAVEAAILLLAVLSAVEQLWDGCVLLLLVAGGIALLWTRAALGPAALEEIRRAGRQGFVEGWHGLPSEQLRHLWVEPQHTWFEPQPPRDSAPPRLNDLSPRQFEELVAELLRQSGAIVASVIGGAGDNGADVIADFPSGKRVVVQCKHYTSQKKIVPKEIREFNGCAWYDHQADIALFVTSSQFTDLAAESAAKYGIKTINGAQAGRWCAGEIPEFIRALV
ncbi:restriction endonuclease [Frankia sp. R82]|uniref:restriction endonuclease n=1 Tax=Frankia sp. R82 TaxID=2950553 RepID=UPI002043E008|nr:restriction endonuclease [Frankia sp. R82]MCM3885848.1 restriction endonuclease [Frankia sp. R82]